MTTPTSRRVVRRPVPTVPLAAVRRATGKTQDDIARAVHALGYHRLLTVQDISQYENGARIPRPRLQVLLATAYGLDWTTVTWGDAPADDPADTDDTDDTDDPHAQVADTTLARTA